MQIITFHQTIFRFYLVIHAKKFNFAPKFRKKMKNTLFISAFSAALIAVLSACGGKSANDKAEEVPADSMAYSIVKKAKGDSTLYGLACDGCTDSVVVFLPYEGGDPVTYEIIDARRLGKVFGRPKIGDRLALMVNPEDKEEATLVIDLDELKGSWCNTFMPKFRDLDKMPRRLQRRMMADMPDSIKQKFLVPKEFGFEIKGTSTISPIGMRQRAETSDEMSPVEYPKQKRYSEWRIYNGHLLLATKKHGIDTADIVLLRPDTLILRFKDKEQGYYKKN